MKTTLAIALLMGTLTLTQDTCNSESDEDGDGFTTSQGDCDDAAASTYPGAPELCDAQDNDCDELVDEDVFSRSYKDLDKDGYGAGSPLGCQSGTGYSRVNNDCNDSNANIYPGAPDTTGDGVDMSCGGTDGQEPSVGLPHSTYTTVQAALNAAVDGMTVWIAPGTYKENNITLRGRRVKLASTQGFEVTTLDGQLRGPVLLFDMGETSASGVVGFTVTRGSGLYGGGITCSYASPTLEKLVITSNQGSYGGGINLVYCSPLLKDILVSKNEANYGGGLNMTDSTPRVEQAFFVANTAGSGGGVFLDDSTASFIDVTLKDNGGSGLTGQHAYITLERATVSNNSGGGLKVSYGSLVGKNLLVTHNRTTANGGGIQLSYTSGTLDQLTVVGNSAVGGGGIAVQESSLNLSNSILAFNSGLSLYVYQQGSANVVYSTLFHPYSISHNLATLPSSNRIEDPGLVLFSFDDSTTNDDFHLRPVSTARHAGDPARCTTSNRSGCNPDGSRADLGAFGGPSADMSYYADSDADSLYDGWEVLEFGTLSSATGSSDADGDGLNTLDELNYGTLTTQSDSDLDGAMDGAEVLNGRDPLNPFSVPGVEGLIPLHVPSEAYPTVQAAADAIGREGRVVLGAGTFIEPLRLQWKKVHIEGAGQAETVLDGDYRQRVAMVQDATLHATDLTIAHGSANPGGGIYAQSGWIELERVTVLECEAQQPLTTYPYGGGLGLYYSGAVLRDVEFSKNWASVGGGFHAEASALTLTDVRWFDNAAESSGGGASIMYSHIELDRGTFQGNQAFYLGGALNVVNSTGTIRHAKIVDNTATERAGGIYLYGALNPLLDQTVIARNTSKYGAGVFLYDAVSSFTNSVIAYNEATVAGGNLYHDPTENVPSQIAFSAGILYNPPGSLADNIAPSQSYQAVEPKFLSYTTASGAACSAGPSPDCVPSDFHPALGSPLINGGSSSGKDVDGSRTDIGIYGGEGGGSWDSDQDGVPDYFWPGSWSQAPSGFSSMNYDCNDQDSTLQSCSP